MNARKLALAAVIAALSVMTAAAQMPPEFSSDIQMHHASGEAMNGKMYFGGKKMRFDMNAAGRDMIMINDMNTQTSYMIMPQQKMYMEMHANAAGRGRGPRVPDAKPMDPSNPCANETGVTCKKVGTETVNGRDCDKWEFTSKSNPDESRTVWIDKKLHFPIKMAMKNGTTWDMTNIQEGSQPASLFEVPAGYRKFDMGGMMGGHMPQQPPE